MEKAILGKDFNLGVISFLFHAFTPCYKCWENTIWDMIEIFFQAMGGHKKNVKR